MSKTNWFYHGELYGWHKFELIGYISEIDIEAVGRSMMEAIEIPEHETCSLDWCGDEIWTCDFRAMARAAIVKYSELRK